MVESAARSCSPMNDPWRLPPLTTNSTGAPGDRHGAEGDEEPGEVGESLPGVDERAAAPSASTAKSDSLPAAVTAPRSWGSR
jgi:hypothetical protein